LVKTSEEPEEPEEPEEQALLVELENTDIYTAED
jgi:hypothetical protein